MTTEDFRIMADTIPHLPGVYRFFDDEDTILYVGKAKNLRNRVSSYFGERKDRAGKTRALVRNASRIEFTITASEADALLLENTLIKKFQPRYNVSLRDDKSYSYICIKQERFPRVFITRRVIKDGSTYFGPYTSKARLKLILDLIKTLFPLRTCNLSLSENNILAGKFKVCLEYHIKNCLGPCEGLESEEQYQEKIIQIKNILRGNFGPVRSHFKGEMERLAESLEFEKAQRIKIRLDAFEDYQSKSTVVSTTIKDVDVFAIAKDEKTAYVNYLKVINGAVINTYTQEMTPNLDEDEESLLAFVIPVLREKFNSIAPEILVPLEVPVADSQLQVIVPKIGDKKKLLDMAEQNVKYFLLQKQKDALSKEKKQTPAERILRTLQSDLNMQEVPIHIECFDNSNIQGSHPVSSCVVFKNARPSKGDYRHFNVKTVVGPNDFATMEEVVFRRYRRLLEENKSLPQLILIDGGKGQLSAAYKSLEKLGIQDKVVVIGIAKYLEEIFFPGDSIPLHINKKSESLKLLQQLRNEAHRFAITFHRDQRSKNMLATSLTDIPGVGAKTAQKLLQTFGSVKKLRAASPEAIAEAVGKSTLKKIQAFFEAEPSEDAPTPQE